MNFEPTTNELINILNQRPSMRELLTKSIKKAYRLNPDPHYNNIRTLSEYIRYINDSVKKLPGLDLHRMESITKLDIHRSLIYFYFLINQPLKELYGKGYPRPVLQYHRPFRNWLVGYIKDWGVFFDSPESWNQNIYLRLKKSGQWV